MILFILFKVANPCFHYDNTCEVATIFEVFGLYKRLI